MEHEIARLKQEWENCQDELRKALEAYQRANHIHNDTEAELYERGQAALAALAEAKKKKDAD